MPMNQLRYRTRLIVILSLFAIVPAALLTIIWGGTISKRDFSRRRPRRLGERRFQRPESDCRRSTDTVNPCARQAVDAHERELRTSLEQARRFSFIAGRSMRIVTISGAARVDRLRHFGIESRRALEPADEPAAR